MGSLKHITAEQCVLPRNDLIRLIAAVVLFGYHSEEPFVNSAFTLLDISTCIQ